MIYNIIDDQAGRNIAMNFLVDQALPDMAMDLFVGQAGPSMAMGCLVDQAGPGMAMDYVYHNIIGHYFIYSYIMYLIGYLDKVGTHTF